MPDILKQLKQKYIKSFEQKHIDIRSAWVEKDFSQLQHLLHKLAGSSGSYGFSHLNELCVQAETIIKEEPNDNDSKLTSIIEQILFQLKTKI